MIPSKRFSIYLHGTIMKVLIILTVTIIPYDLSLMLNFAELYLHCNKTVTFRFIADIIAFFLPIICHIFHDNFIRKRLDFSNLFSIIILILLRSIFSSHDELIQNVLQRIVLESKHVLNL